MTIKVAEHLRHSGEDLFARFLAILFAQLRIGEDDLVNEKANG